MIIIETLKCKFLVFRDIESELRFLQLKIINFNNDELFDFRVKRDQLLRLFSSIKVYSSNVNSWNRELDFHR